MPLLLLQVQALSVNSSLRSVTLSLNILTDSGFLLIMQAINQNQHSVVENLDVSNNLIALMGGTRRYLDAYVPSNPALTPTLHINLMGNSLVRDYPEPVKKSRLYVESIEEQMQRKKKLALKVVTHFGVKRLPNGQPDPASFYGYAGFSSTLQQLEPQTHSASGIPLNSGGSTVTTSSSPKKSRKSPQKGKGSGSSSKQQASSSIEPLLSRDMAALQVGTTGSSAGSSGGTRSPQPSARSDGSGPVLRTKSAGPH